MFALPLVLLVCLSSQQNIAVSFSLGGIRSPQSAPRSSSSSFSAGNAKGGSGGGVGRASRDAEPYGDEALAYSRAHVLQRDVQIKIDSVDRGGNFIGSLWYGAGNNKQDLAVELLELGYAHTVDFSLARCPNKDKLIEAEEKAKKARMNIWSLPGALEAEESIAKEMEVDEVMPEVCVSHVEGINHFYIQV